MSEQVVPSPGNNFIRQIIDADLASGRHQQVITRFPPEPNGYLHIGHAKSICLNFGTAQHYGGRCNLRFDDTNPEKEDAEFTRAIERDVRWLGFQWAELCHASDYFQQLYDFAVALIESGHAYVDSQSAERIRETRGTLTEPGVASPFRNRSVAENLDLFARMKAGEFADGSHVLRARIDMASGNINLRDPVIYRIRRAHHHRTGDAWCIYPMYDYTHCLSDMIEGVTHSLCTLEFEDHRALYDWVLDTLDTPCHPRQYEFARLQLEYTVVSKRRLTQLVQRGIVDGWDDPRMPTLAGLRRRGVRPQAIRTFCERIGVTKKDAWIEMQALESCIREDLDACAPRRLAVLDPLRVTLTNLPDDAPEALEFANHPKDESLGTRRAPCAAELYIEREDFAEVPPPKFKRLVPGGEVRLRNSYVIRCDEVIKDGAGKVVELRCSVDADTLGKKPEGRKVKGVIHWVSAAHSLPAEVRLYELLFSEPNPAAAEEFESVLNPDSLSVLSEARVEPALADAAPGETFQFERMGYFCLDPDSDTGSGRLVFNRTITLRDTWAR